MKKQSFSISKQIILFSLVIFGSLLFLEFLVRFKKIAPEVGFVELNRYRLAKNPKIGYEPIPNPAYDEQKGFFYDDWLGSKIYPGDTNPLGYRDREHSIKKEKGTYRIVIIGDSVTIGWAIHKYVDTYPAHLEKNLNLEGFKAEVINFGVVGYTTLQEVETLKDKGLGFKPDLVILQYSLNDDEKKNGLLWRLLNREKKGNKINRYRMRSIYMKSALYRWLRFGLFKEDPKKDKNFRNERFKENYELVIHSSIRENFKKLAQLSKENDFEVMVVVFPFFNNLKEYPHEEEHLLIKSYSEENQFHHLDLLEDYRLCDKNSKRSIKWDNLHPNHAGHRCAGKAIARLVLENFQAN